jgi:hypothetical protein
LDCQSVCPLGYQSVHQIVGLYQRWAAKSKRKCSKAHRGKADMADKVDRAGMVGMADNRSLSPEADKEVAEGKAAAEDTSDSSQTCWRLRSLLRSQTKLGQQDAIRTRDPGVLAKTSAPAIT